MCSGMTASTGIAQQVSQCLPIRRKNFIYIAPGHPCSGNPKHRRVVTEPVIYPHNFQTIFQSNCLCSLGVIKKKKPGPKTRGLQSNFVFCSKGMGPSGTPATSSSSQLVLKQSARHHLSPPGHRGPLSVFGGLDDVETL